MSGSEAVDLVQTSSPAAGVSLLTFNRPQKRNALSKQLIRDFVAEISKASSDPSVKVIIVTGHGLSFCVCHYRSADITSYVAGADLNEVAALDPASARSCRYFDDLSFGMAAIRQPIIAAVNGPALGGGFEVALMCDLIVSSRSAYFALPEIKHGLIPGAGGSQRLTAAIGKYRTMKTILLNKKITAEEAFSCGLVCDIVEDGDLLSHVIDMAAGLATNGSEAMRFAKEAICRADNLCRDDVFEKNLFYATLGTEEKRIQVEKFLATRPSKLAIDRAQPNGSHAF